MGDDTADHGADGARESGQGNADFQWAKFDSEAYFQHYYGEPHPDDDLVIRVAVDALKRAVPKDAALDLVDVGTGPNLIPFFCPWFIHEVTRRFTKRQNFVLLRVTSWTGF